PAVRRRQTLESRQRLRAFVAYRAALLRGSSVGETKVAPSALHLTVRLTTATRPTRRLFSLAAFQLVAGLARCARISRPRPHRQSPGWLPKIGRASCREGVVSV